MLRFSERTIHITIDTDMCAECTSKACIDACKVYARGMLELQDGAPSLAHLEHDEVKRLGTECLACEYECWFRGRSAITIDVPIKGFEEYLAARGFSGAGAGREQG